METQSLTYKENPDNKLQGRVLSNISPTDWWMFGISLLVIAAISVWAYYLSGTTVVSMVAALTFLALLGALMYRFKTGFNRIYLELYYGIGRGMKHYFFGGIWWKAVDTDRRFIRWLRNGNGRRPAMPFNFTVIRAEVDGTTQRVAVLRELDRPYDHVYFVAEGGSFVTHDPSMQMRLVDILASITNRTVSMADLKLGITYLRVVGPADESRISKFFGSNINPIITNPEQFELDDDAREWAAEMQQTLNELRPATRQFGGSRSIGIVKLTIKRDRSAWRRVKSGKITDEELYDLPVVELSRAMADSLATNTMFGFTRVQVLGLAELADFMRASIDVTDIQQYYADKAAGKIPSTDEDIEKIVESEGVVGLNERLQCWPREEIEIGPKGKWVRIDNTYFATLRVTATPKRVRADQFLNLHFLAPPGVWTRIATVGQSVSGETETRNLIYQNSMLLNFQSAMYSNRIVEDPRRRRRRQQVDSQTEEISAHTIAQYFNILVVVAASSERDVLKQRRAMRGSLLDAGFETQFVDEVPHVMDALHSGVLGVNRL
jgi:hypothetical protein